MNTNAENIYTDILEENPDLYKEENLSTVDKAFLYGITCIKNALPDMVTDFIESDNNKENEAIAKQTLLENFIEHAEIIISEFQAEFIVTMIESYETT